MRGRARVLDSRYMEFIEYLKKFGEQQSIARMIYRLSITEHEAGETTLSDLNMEKSEADKMMYSFWQRGWIQIREIEKKGKNGLEKEYALKVRLEEIVEYFAHERQMARSAGSHFSLSRQKEQVLA